MCTCIDIGVLNAKLIMSSNDKKMSIGAHHVLLLSQEADVPNVQQGSYESISLFHGDAVYVVTSHTMDQYCPKKLFG